MSFNNREIYNYYKAKLESGNFKWGKWATKIYELLDEVKPIECRNCETLKSKDEFYKGKKTCKDCLKVKRKSKTNSKNSTKSTTPKKNKPKVLIIQQKKVIEETEDIKEQTPKSKPKPKKKTAKQLEKERKEAEQERLKEDYDDLYQKVIDIGDEYWGCKKFNVINKMKQIFRFTDEYFTIDHILDDFRQKCPYDRNENWFNRMKKVINEIQDVHNEPEVVIGSPSPEPDFNAGWSDEDEDDGDNKTELTITDEDRITPNSSSDSQSNSDMEEVFI